MKKIIALIIVAMLVMAVPAQAYACDCPCCNKNKTTQTTPSKSKKVSLKNAANKEIKKLTKTAKKYGWTVEEKKVVKNTNSKYYVKIKFMNKKHRTYSNLIIHSIKKNGKAQVSWHYRDLLTGQIKETTSSLIETMFRSVYNRK